MVSEGLHFTRIFLPRRSFRITSIIRIKKNGEKENGREKIKGNYGVGEGSVSVTPSLLLQCGKEMMDRIVGFFGSL